MNFFLNSFFITKDIRYVLPILILWSALSQRSKPAAITVTLTVPPSDSSTTVPKIMFASGCATPSTSSAASFTSFNVKLLEPVIDRSIPLAPSIGDSKRGLETAFWRLLLVTLHYLHLFPLGGASVIHNHFYVGEVGIDQSCVAGSVIRTPSNKIICFAKASSSFVHLRQKAGDRWGSLSACRLLLRRVMPWSA